jgi:hypothetical protein
VAKNTKLCRNCKHFLDVPMGPDPPMHFCENPKTKEGPNPIGFLDFHAPACPFFEARNRGSLSQRPTVIVIPPPVVRDEDDAISRLERTVLRIALLVTTVIGLLGFLAWHLRGLFGP